MRDIRGRAHRATHLQPTTGTNEPMGNHRADHRAATRPRSERPDTAYVGRRVAGRDAAAAAATSVEAAPVVPTPVAPAVPGKRKAVKHAGRRGPLFRGLPSMPVVVGVATLAVAVGGVLTSPDATLADADTERVAAPNAASGSIGTGVYDATGRTPTVSRGSQRGAGTDLVAEAQQRAEQRTARLGQMAQQAEQTAREISLNRWVVPMSGYRLTARYGEYGLWSSYHTGLDFAAPTGTPINAVAGGVVTSTGYDGAYGNKTVVTLEDGTEIWYCHQTGFAVSEGDTVRSGDLLGYVGSTGNTTGPHLHLEVRPGGGDPVDPYAAMAQNGVTP